LHQACNKPWNGSWKSWRGVNVMGNEYKKWVA
jgi:hypothetical protein